MRAAAAESAHTLAERSTTDLFVEYFGEEVRPYTMVLVEEVADGGWGRADETLTLEKMGLPAKAS